MDRHLVVLEEMKILLKNMIREEQERKMNRRLDVLDEIKMMMRELVQENKRQEDVKVLIDRQTYSTSNNVLKNTSQSQNAMEDSLPLRLCVDLRGFDGTAPADWIVYAEYVFNIRGTQDKYKFPKAFVRMEGQAYEWIQGLNRQILNLSWERLKEEMLLRFNTIPNQSSSEEDDLSHVNQGSRASTDTTFDPHSAPCSYPAVEADYSPNVEEELINAVIEASEREDGKKSSYGHPRLPVPNDMVTIFVLEESEDVQEKQPLNANPANPGDFSFILSGPSHHDLNGHPQLTSNVFQPHGVNYLLKSKMKLSC